ncbi:hypothetical protein NBRC10512_003194 [Rhodotorula toruloides]|uniref:RHTO0S05e08196g1_1 n=2 Tax=Rhodotorula toruloides TaxID=5286 RepID=A0A061AUL7_RHOTO|nr:uncharacterized protein RHTO_06846 [Rhodotorula toruloides NP11]EMS23787.1 hypothetical protein RHTO_06846 [Rhodotorula toruloides NP11]KAJ8294120.1 hypothetical protein OF846_002689 [Rhodotorula toruloides]CDR40873.1 RHTO0S05e08196g1_1 [Rhodotorula toruloides]
MIVPDQGHSVLFLEDPMKPFFVSMDGKPVPVFFQSSNPDTRCAKASIRGDAGQAFSVGFYDGRQRKSKGRKT